MKIKEYNTLDEKLQILNFKIIKRRFFKLKQLLQKYII